MKNKKYKTSSFFDEQVNFDVSLFRSNVARLSGAHGLPPARRLRASAKLLLCEGIVEVVASADGNRFRLGTQGFWAESFEAWRVWLEEKLDWRVTPADVELLKAELLVLAEEYAIADAKTAHRRAVVGGARAGSPECREYADSCGWQY